MTDLLIRLYDKAFEAVLNSSDTQTFLSSVLVMNEGLVAQTRLVMVHMHLAVTAIIVGKRIAGQVSKAQKDISG